MAQDTVARLKTLIVQSLHLVDLRPEDIDQQAPLFGEGLGLDSVDALELVVALEKEFGIQTETEQIGREAFASVAALAAFVDGKVGAGGTSADG